MPSDFDDITQGKDGKIYAYSSLMYCNNYVEKLKQEIEHILSQLKEQNHEQQ